MVWEPILDLIQNEIAEKGYFLWARSFQDFKREFHIQALNDAPFYISLDFWSKQRNELTQNGMYVIRLGGGRFVILSQEEFTKPYLKLLIEHPQEISFKTPSSFNHLKKAYRMALYKKRSIENPLLEMLGFYGVFDWIFQIALGEDEYHVGPRGNMFSRFDIFFQRKDGNLEKFNYNGQVELDYSIWTKNRVFVIEAKSLTRGGLDIAWHKLTFPAQRFAILSRENGFDISPVYLLRRQTRRTDIGYVFIFSPIKFHAKDGIILNRQTDWTIEHLFSINFGLFTDPLQLSLKS